MSENNLHNIVFTVCTLSHLSRAIVLIDSLKENCDAVPYIIFIDDEKLIPISVRAEYNFVQVEEIAIDDFDILCRRYNISELSFILKPHAAEYFLAEFKNCKAVLYFDSDICIYSSINELFKHFEDSDLILTPHLIYPNFNSKIIKSEFETLRTGNYNLGFFGFSKSDNSMSILRWWKLHVNEYGIENRAFGLSADQFWVNAIPQLFSSVKILKHSGLNVAYWNIYERNITIKNSKYLVNNTAPLVFVHFAAFNPLRHSFNSLLNEKYNGKSLPQAILGDLSSKYAQKLIDAGYQEFSQIKSVYSKSFRQIISNKYGKKSNFKSKLNYLFVVFLSFFPSFVIRFFRKLAVFFLANFKK